MADWLRVLLVVLCLPWSLQHWRRLAPGLAEAHFNHDLGRLLADGRRRKIVVASHGFACIIAPLLRAMPITAELVACPLWRGFRTRAAGKGRLLAARHGEAALAGATVVTDHAGHDADILAAAARPLVIRWPTARYERAFARTYVPLVYTEKAKHPGHLHLLGVFFGKDWMVLLLASALLATQPLPAALGLAFLILSFAIIYEIGYHENDLLGSRLEKKPILTSARLERLGTVHEGQAWVFGALVALPGAVLLAWADASFWRPAGGLPPTALLLWAIWLGWLGVIRATFRLFNRLDERSRLLLHLPLQLMKGLWLAWVLGLPLSPVGAALLLAHALCAWLPYVVYRMGGERWQTPDDLIRLILLTIITASAMAVDAGPASPVWQIVLVFAWAGYKARRQIVACWRQAHLLTGGAAAPAPARPAAMVLAPHEGALPRLHS